MDIQPVLTPDPPAVQVEEQVPVSRPEPDEEEEGADE